MAGFHVKLQTVPGLVEFVACFTCDPVCLDVLGFNVGLDVVRLLGRLAAEPADPALVRVPVHVLRNQIVQA